MVTALYRRYRPENFAELIGQSQVTDPLRTALRTDRVNHAYLFSGPRGCGKTTSARILARCLNCAEGPTDTPCGTCASCVELARDGGGSLDVIEIDAASHNGVDDARDLRDRAAFAPARDRFKIFILDEAHMVTSAGFNALLKLVEEPPEHVKFIFATTEPEKVIGTIRSRTHHYPFRLVPPATMLDYLQQLCESEGVEVQPGVLPLVVRAGGGSVRDTLSLLDQLIAGSEGALVQYERAVALLGFTHGALLDEIVDALAADDAPGAFAAVDRVIQTGQDPRRFVEDLLERLRDLIVVAATREGAAAVLRGVPADELEHMGRQAASYGSAALSRAADIANAALTEMTGATSPRLHLELLLARLLVPAADATERGALARVERLERRVGIEDATGSGASGGARAAVPAAPESASSTPSASISTPSAAPASTASEPAAPAPAVPATAADPASGRPASSQRDAAPTEPTAPAVAAETAPEPIPTSEPRRAERPAAPAPVGPVTLQQVRDAWPEVLEVVQESNRRAWMVAMTGVVRDFHDEVLTLTFPSQRDIEGFRGSAQQALESPSEQLRSAIQKVLGVRVKYIVKPVDGPAAPAAGGSRPAEPAAPRGGASSAPAAPATPSSAPTGAGAGASASTTSAGGWNVARIPDSDPSAPAADPDPAPASAAAGAATSAATPAPAEPGGIDAAGWAAPGLGGSPGFSAAADAADQAGDSAAKASAGDAPSDDDAPPDYDAPPPPDDGVSRPAARSSAAASMPTAAAAPAARRTPPTAPRRPAAPQGQRYGEAVVREILNATFIEEHQIESKVRPVAEPPRGDDF
ncbi:DNA polymerase III subunit gamma and tau [Schumannella sp. 10F1B-5-1]|uniref:DNA polymerase III subunit gamma and tau n=1 Tax=Schumannella sp. 10F1B-5-1 TaxID=2590780 RepID=UPI001131DE02|nr:DNA polymerase III subunit gamma and tau [Schumannella sp. 10F1B-5-1]TPW73457.1 DNA polymerase III subunit gamma and tau [Schumannella sp. 10F1B-5-1]